MAKFFSPEVYFYKKNKKIRETFLITHSVTHSLPPLRGGCQAWGVVVRCTLLRCTRLQYRTCKTSRGHLASHGLGAHGFSTERARLAGGTSLRSWFQKKCLLPAGILIFLPKKVAATWWDFDFFVQKKVAATWWDFYFFSSHFETWSRIFFR